MLIVSDGVAESTLSVDIDVLGFGSSLLEGTAGVSPPPGRSGCCRVLLRVLKAGAGGDDGRATSFSGCKFGNVGEDTCSSLDTTCSRLGVRTIGESGPEPVAMLFPDVVAGGTYSVTEDFGTPAASFRSLEEPMITVFEDGLGPAMGTAPELSKG